jgi:N-methylhydantoinase B
MSRNLIRSAYSTIVRESRDASTALMTPSGAVVAQGDKTIPILLNAFPPVMKEFRARGMLDDIRPGQALITNDAYAGGQHLDDIVLVIPVFGGDRLLGWAASLAHHLDLGAGSPGIHPKAREIFDEGLRIPPLRIDLERDLGPDGILTALLVGNIRVPKQTLGDIRAQIAAVRTGERRLQGLAERHGADLVLGAMNGLLDYAERMTRDSIRAIPNGRYTAEEWLDGETLEDSPSRIFVTIDVEDERIHVDLTGTADQVRGPVNAPIASTLSAVHTAFKYLLLPEEVPANEGCNAPVSVTVPQGSLLNPHFPAPVGARMCVVFKIMDAIFTALAPVIPDKVISPSYSSIAAVAFSQRVGGRQQLYREALGGGYGAGVNYDGASGTAITLTNTANTPVEFTEMTHPYFLVEEYALRRDSGGDGESRGGMGIEKRYRILDDDVLFSAYGDRTHAGAQGLAGGCAGARAQFLIERQGAETELPSKVIEQVSTGDRIRVLTGGGGGYGSPSDAVDARPQATASSADGLHGTSEPSSAAENRD